MGYLVPLPSGSRILVYPPEWGDRPRRSRPGEDILYFMEVQGPSGSGYVYSRDRSPDVGDYPDAAAFFRELVREGYVSPGDEPAVIGFLALDPESFSLSLSVMET